MTDTFFVFRETLHLWLTSVSGIFLSSVMSHSTSVDSYTFQGIEGGEREGLFYPKSRYNRFQMYNGTLGSEI